MPKDKGRKDKRTPPVDDDEEEGDEGEQSESSERVTRDVISRIFSGPNWRRETERTVLELERKNDRLLRKNRELRDRVTTLEELEPEDGEVMLSKADAEAFEAFKQLNLKPADITAAIKERDELKAKDAERENEGLHIEAAEALGYPNVAAFSKAMKREKLHVEMKAEKQDDPENPGKKVTVQVPYVRAADKADAALERAADYIDREISELEPAFLAEPDEEEFEGEEGELVGAGSTRSAERTQERSSARSASNGTTGVSMPVTRNVRPTTGAAREDRRLDERMEQKRSRYRL